MKPSSHISPSSLDSDLEFALETQSGFLVVVKGSGNDGRVTLAVRRRVGTPPTSAIVLAPDEVKRLINLLGELSPLALRDKDKLLVGKARDAYLDDLMANGSQAAQHDDAADLPHNMKNADAEMSLFMERDFPELASKRKNQRKTFLGASSSNPIHKISDAFADLREKQRRSDKSSAGIFAMVSPAVLMIGALVILGALSTVALLNYQPFASHKKAESAPVVVPVSQSIEDFSKNFVQDMLTFKIDTYRQAQVRCMAQMSPELAQKYWQETGFPLTRSQLRAIPQDQQTQIVSTVALPVSPGIYQVDVEGSVTAQAGAKTMPLHIRLTASKDATGKYTVTEQKDLSSAPTPQ
ncbi:MAG: hypothetical protein KGS72_09815 [Cyanobacteria bacterium REEB67]|nr:hypothetical protein [Cyanobacteria bacterium REEB67]